MSNTIKYWKDKATQLDGEKALLRDSVEKAMQSNSDLIRELDRAEASVKKHKVINVNQLGQITALERIVDRAFDAALEHRGGY